MKYAICFGLAALLTPAFGGGASAQHAERCLQRGDMVAKLGAVYEEIPVEAGVTAAGGVVELLRTANGESWSLIMTYPTGVSCMLAAGQAWHLQSPPEPEKKPVS